MKMESKIYCGDCLEVMKGLPDNSVDAIVTDPPYGLSFMGKKWDYDVPSVEIWKECLRVLKPGGYLLAFAGTRTQHRMAVRIEDAGFEIRDMIAWVYGSGFPKSLSIGKAVDKLQGNEREVVGEKPTLHHGTKDNVQKYGFATEGNIKVTKGTSEWEGWGTALKPALEPITVARKPLSEKTVAENCLKWGTGGINIDGCRVGTEERTYGGMSANKPEVGTFRDDNWQPKDIEVTVNGRFPANLIHDGSDEVVELFPTVGSKSLPVRKTANSGGTGNVYTTTNDNAGNIVGYADKGSASRFFYCAKASKSERNMGCEELEESVRVSQGLAGEHKDSSKNSHPTVKPIALMEYLIKLVSKDGATILDPFMGSGSTILAAININRKYIGIEINPEYFEIAKRRIKENMGIYAWI